MNRTIAPGRVKGTLTPPCSKSYAQRALAAALLSREPSVLRNLEFCDDTRSAMRCIETLGARVEQVDATSLSIAGGLAPRGLRLDVGESGLSTRLFTPIAALCPTPVTIVGRGTHEELLHDCPAYLEIAKSQLSERDLAAAGAREPRKGGDA